jgi:hypothetical protein
MSLEIRITCLVTSPRASIREGDIAKVPTINTKICGTSSEAEVPYSIGRDRQGVDIHSPTINTKICGTSSEAEVPYSIGRDRQGVDIHSLQEPSLWEG